MKFSGFLSGKIKVIPEDFIVREIISLNTIKTIQNSEYKYYVYELKKINWNTVDILIRIANENGIPFSSIHYGGRKDRYGITYQYISSTKELNVPSQYKDKVELKFIGFTNTPISTKNIKYNEFIITIRSIQEKEWEKISRNMEFVNKYGFINYFDSQRFSSFNMEKGIPGIYILYSDYQNYLKNYLINTFSHESKHAKDRKFYIEKHWGDWEKCVNYAKTKIEKKIFKYLMENKNNPDVFKNCIDFLPSEEIRFSLSILQAYIWNLCVSEFLKDNVKEEKLAYFKSRIGTLVFLKEYMDLSIKEFPLLHSSVIYKVEYHSYFEKIWCYIKQNYFQKEESKNIRENHLHLNLNIKKERLAFQYRKIVEFPEKFKILSIENDDIYKNKKLLRIKFSLNSGSYATMLIKRILLRI